MKKIFSIKGDFSLNHEYNFKYPNTLTGYLIMKDDSKFEGIVKDIDADDNKLIIGTISDNHEISLIKLDLEYDSSMFQATFDGEKMLGDYIAISPIITIPFGRCKIILNSVPEDKATIEQLEKQIEDFKSQMGTFNSNIYHKFFEKPQKKILKKILV